MGFRGGSCQDIQWSMVSLEGKLGTHKCHDQKGGSPIGLRKCALRQAHCSGAHLDPQMVGFVLVSLQQPELLLVLPWLTALVFQKRPPTTRKPIGKGSLLPLQKEAHLYVCLVWQVPHFFVRQTNTKQESRKQFCGGQSKVP